MGIRVLFAAAVVAVGAGQAEAATANYDLWLRYEGTSFSDYLFYDGWNNLEAYSGEFYPADHPQDLNVPHAQFPTLQVGDIIRFVATIIFPDDPDQYLGQWDNGGRALVCSIGQTSCSNTQSAYQRGAYGAFEITFDDKISISGRNQIGSEFVYSEFNSESGNYEKDRWTHFSRFADAYFTVVETPAPVPLPATAALLPLGLGALALVRRRRRAS